MLRRSCNKPSHCFQKFWVGFLGCCHAFYCKTPTNQQLQRHSVHWARSDPPRTSQKLDPKKRRDVHCFIAVRADLAAERREYIAMLHALHACLMLFHHRSYSYIRRGCRLCRWTVSVLNLIPFLIPFLIRFGNYHVKCLLYPAHSCLIPYCFQVSPSISCSSGDNGSSSAMVSKQGRQGRQPPIWFFAGQ